LSQGQGERELGTRPGVPDSYLAAVKLHYRFHDSQPQAAATACPITAGFYAEEAIEDLRQLLVGGAGAGIGQHYLSGFLVCDDLEPESAAPWGEAYGVVEQIHRNLGDALWIGMHLDRAVSVQVEAMSST